MPDVITTSTSPGISQRTNVYAEREMLKHAEPVMVLEKTGKAMKMPKNKSVTIKWRRPVAIEIDTTPLQEGVTPSSKRFQYEDISATLTQHGNLTTLTDVIEDTHEDPVLNNMSMMMGENAGATWEQLNYGVLIAGTNVFYNNGAARNSVNTALTLSRQRAVTRALDAQKADMITNIIDPSPNFGTMAVEAAFIAVAHTDLSADIRNLAGFVPVAKYGSIRTVSPREIGMCENVRYVLSPDLAPIINAGGTPGTAVLSTGGSAADVYPILYFGKEAWGYVGLRGEPDMQAIDPTIINPGQKTKDDPLGQRGYVGWKSWWAAAILNDLWMARLEVGASVL
jgi:N4-gp56 family major capsid protein